jgi:hypothetical protein
MKTPVICKLWKDHPVQNVPLFAKQSESYFPVTFQKIEADLGALGDGRPPDMSMPEAYDV